MRESQSMMQVSRGPATRRHFYTPSHLRKCNNLFLLCFCIPLALYYQGSCTLPRIACQRETVHRWGLVVRTARRRFLASAFEKSLCFGFWRGGLGQEMSGASSGRASSSIHRHAAKGDQLKISTTATCLYSTGTLHCHSLNKIGISGGPACLASSTSKTTRQTPQVIIPILTLRHP